MKECSILPNDSSVSVEMMIWAFSSIFINRVYYTDAHKLSMYEFERKVELCSNSGPL